jgi:preprotein translocase subunit SecE
MNLVEKVKGWPAATRAYVNELQLEMKRVTWPNKKQVQSTTAVVILTVFAFAAYFAVVDLLLTRSVTKVYDVFTK